MKSHNEEEAERLKALYTYDILDSPAELEFDDLTTLAAQICQTPIALISLLDQSRQWFKSKVGLTVSETPKVISFCLHTIQSDHPLVIEDALQDVRFANNPLVTGEPNIRFYAGVPLIVPSGHRIGTLCVIAPVPMRLTDVQIQRLQALGRQVVSQLELRHTNRLLAERESMLRSFFDSAPMMMGVVELLEDDILHLSDNVETARLFGIKPAQMQNRRASEMGLPDDYIRQWISRYREAEKTHQPQKFEYSHETEAGQRWLSATVVAVESKEGRPARFAYVVEDISDRKQTEENLRQSEQKFRAIFDGTFQFIGLLDPAGIVIEANQPALDAIGVKLTDVVGQPFWATPWWTHSPVLQAQLKQGIDKAAQGELVRFEAEHILADGTSIFVDFSIQPIVDDTENVIMLIPEGRNINDRKQAEVALHQQLIQEQLVTETAQYIRQSLDLKEVLRRTVERVRHYLQTDRVVIFHFEPDLDWQGTIVMECVGSGWKSIQSQSINDPCFRDRYVEPYRLGRISTLSDAHAEGLEPCYIKLLESMQVQANVVVPILQDEQLWGLLVAHHCGAPRQWHSEEIRLLQQLATHLGIAIQQSELYQQIHHELLERRQIQDALQTSEERFRALSESAPMGIFQTDVDGVCIYTNAHWQRLTGLTLEASVGEGWLQAIHPEERATVVAEWESAVCNRRGFVKEFRFLTPEGIMRWVSAYGNAMRSPKGELLGYVGTAKDITERKLAQAALERLNHELELKVQQRTIALEQMLEQERVLGAITQQVRRSLDLDEILDTAVTEVRQVLKADRALIFQLTSQGSGVVIKESILPQYPVTLEMRFPDECFPQECYEYYCQGQPRIVLNLVEDDWADCIAPFMAEVGVKTKIVAPIVQRGKDDAPRVWGLLIVHSCAYQRQWQPNEAKLMQQICNQVAIALQQSKLHYQLQNSETRFRNAFDFAGNGMAMLTLNGQFMQVNSALCQLLGYSEPELLQLTGHNLIQQQDFSRYRDSIQDLISSQTANLQIESALIHKSGKLLWVLCSLSLVCDPQGKPLHLVVQIQDITERRALEQMKNEFISVVSHELRTPLTSIRGSLGMLVSGLLDSQPEVSKQMIEIAALESERLVRLVNDILDLERLDNKKITLNYQWCDAAEIMESAIAAVNPVAIEKGIDLDIAPTNIQVWADPDRIIQVLVNLVSNAIKFSPASSTVWVSVQTENVPIQDGPTQEDESRLSHQSQVLFQIKDQGKGIPADKLVTIFERFQQVNASDSRDQGGTGLGLAICQSIVQQQGGSIWVESTLGEGSTFYFTLPVAQNRF